MSENEGLETSEVWNVAQGYTQLKILKPLVEMDKLIKISIYGAEYIKQSLQILQEMKLMNRIEALNRFVDILRELIENTYFALGKEIKPVLEQLEFRVMEVNKVINAISRITTDQRTGKRDIVINEMHFTNCLEELRDIKKKITDPLNKNGLIFPSSEEIDLDKIKNNIIYGG
jgi:hypothetical protein